MGPCHALAAGAPTIISIVLHVGNVAQIPDYLRVGRELGVQAARCIPLKWIGHGRAAVCCARRGNVIKVGGE